MNSSAVKAVVQSAGKLVDGIASLPTLISHQVLVKINSAAFNLTDRLALDVNAFGDGAVLGCDFAGVVKNIGPDVSLLKVGDRVAALVWGGETKGLGAYASHCIADEHIAFKIPQSIGFMEAATIPLATNTAWLALFSRNCLSMSREMQAKQSLLVWGGSSTVGKFAIQLATHYGMEVIATCSPRNFEAAKAAGAKHSLDYKDSEVVSKIQAICPDLSCVFDTIGNSTSSAVAASCVQMPSGKLCTVRPGKVNTENVPSHIDVSDVFVFTAFLKPHSYRNKSFWPADPYHHALSAELYKALPEFLQSGVIHTHPVLNMGMLTAASVERAMDLNRRGEISNSKLCFSVNEE